jgi:hypothetical protein
LELSYRELVVGDQIGPADVLQPVTHTVVAVPEISTEDRFAARAALKLEAATDGVVTSPRPRQSDTVFVRRYYATVTVTRSGGSVDARKPKMWFRPVGDAVTPVDADRLRLQPGDRISIVAA